MLQSHDLLLRCTQGIEEGKNEIIEILNNKASTKAKLQKFDTMAEQVNIRKAHAFSKALRFSAVFLRQL